MEVEERLMNEMIDDVFNIIDLIFKSGDTDIKKLKKLISSIPYEEKHCNFKLLLKTPEALDMMLDNAKIAGMNFVLYADKGNEFQITDILVFKTQKEAIEFIENTPEMKGHDLRAYSIDQFIAQYGKKGTQRAELIKKISNVPDNGVIMYQNRELFEKNFKETYLEQHEENVFKAYSLIEKEAKILRLYQLKQEAISLLQKAHKSPGYKQADIATGVKDIIDEIKSINNYSANLTGSERQQQKYFVQNNSNVTVQNIKSSILEKAAQKTEIEDAKNEIQQKPNKQSHDING